MGYIPRKSVKPSFSLNSYKIADLHLLISIIAVKNDAGLSLMKLATPNLAVYFCSGNALEYDITSQTTGYSIMQLSAEEIQYRQKRYNELWVVP